MNDPDVQKMVLAAFRARVSFGDETTEPVDPDINTDTLGFPLCGVVLDGTGFKTKMDHASLQAAVDGSYATAGVMNQAFMGILSSAGSWEHENNPLKDPGMKLGSGVSFYLPCVLNAFSPVMCQQYVGFVGGLAGNTACVLDTDPQYVRGLISAVDHVVLDSIAVNLLVHVAVKNVVCPRRSVSVHLLTELGMFGRKVLGAHRLLGFSDLFIQGVTYKTVHKFLEFILKGMALNGESFRVILS